MQHLTVHLGSANPAFFAGRPTCARALHRAADRLTPPVSGITARHCAAAHLSVLSLPALSGWHARARRPRAPCLGRCRATTTSRGQAPRNPRAAWHHHARDPPFSLFFPLCSAAAEPLAPRSRVDSSSRPHSSLTPSLERPSFPTAPRTRTAASEHRRRPPLPGELLPELPIPEISCKTLTPSTLPSCRTSSPLPATTGAPSPPTNAAARRRWHRLTVDPPFWCAPVLSSLPGTFPVTPS
jgi:hypothetical protein